MNSPYEFRYEQGKVICKLHNKEKKRILRLGIAAVPRDVSLATAADILDVHMHCSDMPEPIYRCLNQNDIFGIRLYPAKTSKRNHLWQTSKKI